MFVLFIISQFFCLLLFVSVCPSGLADFFYGFSFLYVISVVKSLEFCALVSHSRAINNREWSIANKWNNIEKHKSLRPEMREKTCPIELIVISNVLITTLCCANYACFAQNRKKNHPNCELMWDFFFLNYIDVCSVIGRVEEHSCLSQQVGDRKFSKSAPFLEIRSNCQH